MAMNYKKYKPFPKIELENRTWPNNEIKKAPIWCSVGLRDGNQALPIPMGVEAKLSLYNVVLKMGFKQIEVGFPSASETEFSFLRKLVEDDLIPDGVAIQVLVQAREHLIKRTFEALEGVKEAIVHLYNSTSELQRRVVFRKDKESIKEIALNGVGWIKEYKSVAEAKGTKIRLEYSPESFTGTELEYAAEVCNEVIKLWEPTPDNKIIINLPSTVEMATPNVYADQIEWMDRHLINRDLVEISLHAHNDRGTATAATELGILAGADRVEGTLFGNGERTGNTDILNVAMNLYSQGIDPELNIYDINEIRAVYEKATQLPVHPRHPYAGDLVYTAFSGSHQDAINKGLKYKEENEVESWEIPYLPIDPADLGREYESIIRINSQSGKGGIAFVLESEYGYRLPKKMHPDFAKVIQKITDNTGKELLKEEILNAFKETYIDVNGTVAIDSYKVKSKEDDDKDRVIFKGEVIINGEKKDVKGEGNGPLSAFVHGLHSVGLPQYKVLTYEQHALEVGEDSQAIAYVEIENMGTGSKAFGVGTSSNITSASLRAITSAINRSHARE